MKTITKQMSTFLDISNFFENVTNSEVLFFDIETTGFSPLKDYLYLIGCIYFNYNHWTLTQFFAETPEDQKEIIHDFSILCKNFRVLIHFNGDTFDIPFLTKKMHQVKEKLNLEDKVSIDLLKTVRPYQHRLGLPNCKLKSIEKFLEIYRQDMYSGKDLIEQYKAYIQSNDSRLENNLLLHNEEDLYGLMNILSIRNSILFLEKLKAQKIDYRIQKINQTNDELFLTIHLDEICPFELSIANDFYKMRIQKNEGTMYIAITLFQGDLYHFFDNYKDYYYLPDQDEAIHKSVGSFLPSQRRKQATASNCYIKKHGIFIPMFEPISDIAMFYTKPKDNNVYILLENNSSAESFKLWLDQCFRHL